MKICPKCGSLSQVWVNQESRRLTCHKVGCQGAGGLDEPLDFPPTDFMKLAQSKPTNGLTVIDSQPTPLASTAMEAAREIHNLHYLDASQDNKAAIIQKHFQPLLAKVEIDAHAMQVLFEQVATALDVSTLTASDRGHGEMLCDILDSIDVLKVQSGENPISYVHLKDRTNQLRKENTALRADLAAKEAALTQIFKWWDAHDGHLTTAFSHSVDRKMESFRSALASRADKGGAR